MDRSTLTGGDGKLVDERTFVRFCNPALASPHAVLAASLPSSPRVVLMLFVFNPPAVDVRGRRAGICCFPKEAPGEKSAVCN